MCSLSRSISTSPGMSRSPVNSAKVILQVLLQVPLGADARVDFDPAGQVQVAVDLGFGAAHLQRDGVIDPIAHLVTHEGAVGNRRGEREGGRIELGSGAESFLVQIGDELVANTYRPMQARKKEIPKDGGKKVRVLSIPAIRDRVVQGALKLILEPVFEADFQAGSFGYRPKRTAHEAVARVARAIVEEKTRIIDLDLSAYFDNVQHSLLLEKVARRIRDDAVMHLLKMILKATGKKGVPQGGVISPLLSNLYLNEVDRMLEKAVDTTRRGKSTNVQ